MTFCVRALRRLSGISRETRLIVGCAQALFMLGLLSGCGSEMSFSRAPNLTTNYPVTAYVDPIALLAPQKLDRDENQNVVSAKGPLPVDCYGTPASQPSTGATAALKATAQVGNADFTNSDQKARGCLEQAREYFYKDSATAAARRDRILGRLLFASDASCTAFKGALRDAQAGANASLGVASTALAAAGSIVADAASAKALASLAGFTAGARSEINSDYFYDQTTGLITKGIDQARQDLLSTITQKIKKPIDEYPLEFAIRDALEYHADCSVDKGIEKAGKDITLVENPGLDMLSKAMLKANTARQILQHPEIVDSAVLNPDGTGNQAALGLFGSTVASGDQNGDPSRAYDAAADGIAMTVASAINTLSQSQLPDATADKSRLAVISDLDTIRNNALDNLRDTCAATAASVRQTLTVAESDYSEATGDKKGDATVALSDARDKAAMFASQITHFKNTVVARVSAPMAQYEPAVSTYMGTKTPSASDKSNLQAEIGKIDSALQTLAGQVGKPAAGSTNLLSCSAS